MSPRELLAAAARLVDRADESTRGVWARAAAICARQALELELARRLPPGVQAAPFATQLLVYRVIGGDANAAYVWAALSRACHHQGYELPPTAMALRGWIADVDGFLAVGERAS